MIKDSKEFKEYLVNGDKADANSADIKRLFLGTMETPNIVISKNIQSLKSLAEDTEDKNLLIFFDFCIKKLHD